MDRIIDLTESRKAKLEKNEQFRDAASELLSLLDGQRERIPEEFMTFLLALAISDQAMFYDSQNPEAGGARHPGSRPASGSPFLEELFVTVRQLYETQYPPGRKPTAAPPLPPPAPRTGQVIEFPTDNTPTPLD